MSKKKILLYSHQANLAGAPLSLAALASGLKKDYEPIFVTPAKGAVLSKVQCRKKIIGKWFQILRLIRIIREEKIDLVHANTILALPAVYAAKFTNTKVVWHIREDMGMFPEKMPRKILSLADAVIIISDSMKKYFRKSKKVFRVYNGLKGQRSPAKQNGLRIVFAGTLEKRKGVLELLKAVQLLKKSVKTQFKVDIYGKELPVSRHYYKALLNFVRRNELTDTVSFKGVTDDISRVIAGASVVAIPSLSEPFGRVAVEAMIQAKPVVASDCGGLSEIIVHKSTGYLVKTGNPGEMANSLSVLLENKNMSKKMGMKGYQRYKKMFTLEKHLKEVSNIYKKLLK